MQYYIKRLFVQSHYYCIQLNDEKEEIIYTIKHNPFAFGKKRKIIDKQNNTVLVIQDCIKWFNFNYEYKVNIFDNKKNKLITIKSTDKLNTIFEIEYSLDNTLSVIKRDDYNNIYTISANNHHIADIQLSYSIIDNEYIISTNYPDKLSLLTAITIAIHNIKKRKNFG